jgi:maltooligosyltrehalose trehalohydrolase
VIYELHVGTFTSEGTFAAAADQLAELASLGVTVLEVMPVAEFPGRFGWGYDGVDLFAPFHGYGTPDDLRAFVNRAHEECLGVMLDVVYNHFGPDGNYLRQFSDDYFNPRYVTDWGDAINYDGDNSGPVREMALSNARHWIAEYHLDGLRLDATDNIYDESEPNLIEALGVAARDAAGGRGIIVIGENEAQTARLITPRTSPPPAGVKPISRITAGRLRNCSRRSSTGFCIRDSDTIGRRADAGRRHGIFPLTGSFTSWRITIRWRIPATAGVCIS